MRDVLQKIEIVGATMCYKEQDQCKYCLDWLCNFCDRVIILLDNYDKITEQIVLKYGKKYKNKVNIIYSTELVREEKSLIQGQQKKRFKLRQPHIREQVIKKLHKLNKEKAVDLFIFLDSDEIPINQFSFLLEEFYNERTEKWMMLGFLEVFNNFKTIVHQIMAPHGRVYKYDVTLSALPYQPRTIYFPFNNGRPWKVRNVLIHLCHLTEKYRKRRQFFDNRDWTTECDRRIYQTEKDVREMTIDEIALYQNGQHGIPPKAKPITLKEYLKNNKLN